MKLPAMAFVVALSCVAVHGEADLIRGSAAPVTIFTQFDHEHAPAVFEMVKTELAAIMTPIGLEFEWRSLEDTHNNPAVELVVVSFKGSCRMEELAVYSPTAGALGWTHTSDGVVLPFSDIDCDQVRHFISRKAAGSSLHEREMLLGRALGRVLAHELYHVFANTKQHGRSGVAKPFYTPSELVSEHFVFEKKESHTLRSMAVPALIQAQGTKAPVSTLVAK